MMRAVKSNAALKGIIPVLLMLAVVLLFRSSAKALTCYHCQLSADPFQDDNCKTKPDIKWDCENYTVQNELAPVNTSDFWQDLSSDGCMTIQTVMETVESIKGKQYKGHSVTKTCFPYMYKDCIEKIRSKILKDGDCFSILGEAKILKFLSDKDKCIEALLEGKFPGQTKYTTTSTDPTAQPPAQSSSNPPPPPAPIPPPSSGIVINGQTVKSKITKFSMCYCTGDLCNDKIDPDFYNGGQDPRKVPVTFLFLLLWHLI